ncbi:MAG TPA: prepilin-type N-terminal cleavage/methylation domain-containing protein [Terriglobales bacterium]|nr:prepilin-type N-terminal cleavage/methylation domain-containing protein [Terriglobales bacterium]
MRDFGPLDSEVPWCFFRHRSVTGAERSARSAGFSLVEMMTVVVIIVIIGAVAIPFLIHVMAAYRMSSAAKSLAFELNMTRVRAASKFNLARLSCDNTSAPASCKIELCNVQAGNGLCDNTASPAWISDGEALPLPANVYFGFGSISKTPTAALSANAETYQIVFNSRGLPVDITGAKQIPKPDYALYIRDAANPNNDDATYAVTVAASGAVSVWQYSSANNAWGTR